MLNKLKIIKFAPILLKLKNINYKYNPNTLDYEEVKLSFWENKLSYYLIAVVLSVLIISFSFYNTKSYIQKKPKENQSLRQKYRSK